MSTTPPPPEHLLLITETPNHQHVRICCEMLAPTIDITTQHQIMNIHLYTNGGAYRAALMASSLNQELNWNFRFSQMLKDCLNGLNQNAVIEFEAETLMLKVSCDFDCSSMRILFFQVQLAEVHQPPLRHARRLLQALSVKNDVALDGLLNQHETYSEQLKKIDQMKRQIKDTQEFDLEFIKNKFIPIINDAKAKLRPHFNPNFPPKPKLEDSEESEGSHSTRKKYVIKRASSSLLGKDLDFQKLFK